MKVAVGEFLEFQTNKEAIYIPGKQQSRAFKDSETRGATFSGLAVSNVPPQAWSADESFFFRFKNEMESSLRIWMTEGLAHFHAQAHSERMAHQPDDTKHGVERWNSGIWARHTTLGDSEKIYQRNVKSKNFECQDVTILVSLVQTRFDTRSIHQTKRSKFLSTCAGSNPQTRVDALWSKFSG